MNITDVRIKLVEDQQDRLKAFCAVTFDGEFVVRDLKVIRGPRGLFVAMPNRKITVKCDCCSTRVDSKSRFCTNCGSQISKSMHDLDGERTRQYADIAHPINANCRRRIEAAVLSAFEYEQQQASLPDYVCRYNEPHDALVAAG
jgi:stage V sporulation protein G